MALTACRECGQQVSTEADTCPHCGVASPAAMAPPPTQPAQSAAPVRSSSVALWVIGGVLVLFVFLLVGPQLLRATGRSSLTGGKTDADVVVDAPAGMCWSASIGGATQQGCGRQTFPVHDPLGLFSSNVQKRDASSDPVTIDVVIDGQTVATNTTSAAYGVAQVVVSP